MAQSTSSARAPLPLNEEMTRVTIRNLVGRVEAVAMVVQGFAILSTINVDQLSGAGRTLMYCLTALHLGAAGVTARVGGPFFHGGSWPLLWLAAILASPLLMALLVPPGNYGVSPACPQLCGYSAPPVAIVAFYPWVGKNYNYLAAGPKAALISLTSIEPLVIELLFNGRITKDNIQGLIAQTFIVVGVWAAGEAIGRICRRAAAAQAETLRREYDRQFGYLHSDIETSLRLVELHYRDDEPRRVLDALNDLKTTVLDERLALTLAQDVISVADVIRLHVRRMRGRLDFVCVPSVDVISLPQEKGRLLSQALGDFLKNALVHGGHRVEIEFWVDERDTAHLQVCDDGPGFDASVLNDPLTSLHALQRRTVAAGGDLHKDPSPNPCCVRLTLPIRGPK
ncbi:hypothetical protein ACFW1F_36975 [Streptomyces bungoensis]|uniref:hypothetical protein n=1 Tax=Streptomyces bungoensis TaxID=285568 RepID=UPI00369B6EAB